MHCYSLTLPALLAGNWEDQGNPLCHQADHGTAVLCGTAAGFRVDRQASSSFTLKHAQSVTLKMSGSHDNQQQPMQVTALSVVHCLHLQGFCMRQGAYLLCSWGGHA